MRYRTLRVKKATGEVTIDGVDMGQAHLVAWNRTQGFLVVKVAGGKYWTGLGQPFAYAPASYATYRVQPRQVGVYPMDDGNEVVFSQAEQVIETNIRSEPMNLKDL